MTDIVITYVDGNDPLWREDFAKAVNEPAITKRYRDWGTLKFLLRGVEKHMHFVGQVFLVVSRESQVPAWIDREKVRVVLHGDIIPREFLPVFNSTAIEMFLHRIPGLADRYLYFNDDMFPVRKLGEETFYPGGKAAMGFSRHLFASNKYLKRCRNSDRLAREALGLRPSPVFVRPQHICSPMLRPDCEELFARMEDRILKTVSPLRTTYNLNQYLYLDYSFHKGDAIARRLSCRHVSLAVWTPDRISAFLRNPDRDLVCINDVHMDENQYNRLRSAIIAAFESALPDKSKYEK